MTRLIKIKNSTIKQMILLVINKQRELKSRSKFRHLFNLDNFEFF